MNGLQRAGKDFDNQIANALHGNTPEPITAHAARGSGNTKHPAADVLVRTPVTDHFIELKKRSKTDRGERTEIINESQKDDVSQLLACRNKFTDVYLAVKFSHCELVVVRADYRYEDARAFAERFPDAFEASATDGGNVRIQKPVDTDSWPSSTAGKDDAAVLAEAMGIDYEIPDK